MLDKRDVLPDIDSRTMSELCESLRLWPRTESSWQLGDCGRVRHLVLDCGSWKSNSSVEDRKSKVPVRESTIKGEALSQLLGVAEEDRDH